jgi:hypothetical protein
MAFQWTVDKSSTERLDLGDGQWIEIRKQLTSGEERELSRRAAKRYQKSGPSGDDAVTVEFDVTKYAPIRVASYVVSWSAPVVLPPNFGLDKRIEIVEGLDPRAVDAMDEAVVAFLRKRDAERSAEKKDPATPSGETASDPTSPSPAG